MGYRAGWSRRHCGQKVERMAKPRIGSLRSHDRLCVAASGTILGHLQPKGPSRPHGKSPATGGCPTAGSGRSQRPGTGPRPFGCLLRLSQFQVWGLTRLGIGEGTGCRTLAQGSLFPAVFLCSENNPGPLGGGSQWVAGVSRALCILMSGCKWKKFHLSW